MNFATLTQGLRCAAKISLYLTEIEISRLCRNFSDETQGPLVMRNYFMSASETP
jgi:hypothetical protein